MATSNSGNIQVERRGGDHEGDSQADNSTKLSLDDIITTTKIGDWRRTLSGTLDEQHLLFALIVLITFYIGYTLVSVTHDNNEKDEYVIIQNCTCKSEHKNFYISWLFICSLMWILLHLLATVLRHGKSLCSRKCSSLKRCSNDNCLAKAKDQTCFKKLRSMIYESGDDLHRYENYLWIQYYELSVIGSTKEIDDFSRENVQKIIKY